MFGAIKSAFKSIKDTVFGSIDKDTNSNVSSKDANVNTDIETPKVADVLPKADHKSEKKPLTKKETKTTVKEDKVILPKENIVKSENKLSFLSKIKSAFSERYYLSKSDIDNIIENLEITFLQSDVSIEVCDQILKDLRQNIERNGLYKGASIDDSIKALFLETIIPKVKLSSFDFSKNSKKPYIILFIGTNGTGKTTTIAKVASYLKSLNKTVVLGACDTYRAASIEQLEGHSKAIGVDIIKGKYGVDASSVAYDTISYAKSRGTDYVLLDSAGRQENNISLMKELQKLKRVASPDQTIFVIESTSGQNAIVQSKSFDKEVSFDSFILTKTDVDQKGGTLLSISIGLDKPIIFIGTGQTYNDLKQFDKELLENIFE